MAWQLPSFCIGALIAAADLSAKQFHIVKVTGDNQFNLAGSGEVALGILQDKPESGLAGDVLCLGVSKVRVGVGETLVAGGLYGADASGQAQVVQPSLTGADLGGYALGMVLEGAGAGELATVTVGFPAFRVQES